MTGGRNSRAAPRGLTKVEFLAMNEGAYRVSIQGEDPRQSANLLVTGLKADQPVTLPPGKYNILVEDLSRGSQRSVSLELHGQSRMTVPLDSGDVRRSTAKAVKPPRPSRREDELRSSAHKSEAISTSVPSAPAERHMTLGLSTDTRPDQRGGWRPGLLQAHLPPDTTGKIFAFVVEQPPDWRKTPKWRLTVAVENDVATHVPLPLFRGGVRVELSAVDTPAGPDVAVSMLPLRPQTAALVGALKRNLSGDPAALVEWSSGSNVEAAVFVLSEKMKDPWAAAAAALLLVRSGRISPAADWAKNLANRFAWLADAGVVAAWAHAATSKDSEPDIENDCLRRLVWARRRGSLYYSASNALAIEMLTTLASGGTGPNIRSRAQKELASWSRWTKRLVRGSTFVNWEETGNRLTAGTLPRRHYAILATGMVSLSGVRAEHDLPLDFPAAELLSPLWSQDTQELAFEAPDVEAPSTPPTFKLALDEGGDIWRLTEPSGTELDTFRSKADALSAGTLKTALGVQGGNVEIYSHDGHFQEERFYPGGGG